MPEPPPLDGVRVLDLTIALAGPFATLQLAALGAEVIRVETPDGSGDLSRWNPPFVGPDGPHFEASGSQDVALSALNRSQGKKSVTLNLKTPEGQALFHDLAAQSDVVMENFSEGTAARLGVGYPAVRARNPRIVYCSITGFGQDNPYDDLKAMDIIVQAMSGLMHATGTAGGPPVRIGIPIGDLAGSLYATTGVCAALLRAARTGAGCHLDVSLLDCLASLVSVEHFEVYERAGVETRTGNAHARMTPFGVYPAADGHVAVAAHTDRWTRALLDVMGRPELAGDERFATRGARVRHTAELTAIIEAWSVTVPRDELVRRLREAGLPAAAVRTPPEAMADRHLARRGALVPLPGTGAEPAIGTGLPIRDGSAPHAAGASPRLGEHTEAVLGELLGIDATSIARLRETGVV